ncbi:amino acid ABC transporter permease [Neisseria sp. Ec49-e6-T10]|uniref:amino acid ABC transporter permease n=1 Tax=Neisseria sp. Ec49-e6-T10 TaxID=3140744 RepID=UPI003EB71571
MSLNWEYIIRFLPMYEKALWLTLKLSFWGILFAFIIGMVCSIVTFYKVRVLSQIVNGYVAFFRNTPLLIQLFFMFYGLPKIGLTLSPEVTAVIGLSLLGGSFMAEAFRGGIEAVAKSQLESGVAIGLNKFQLARYVILPQALSYSVPALGANCIFLIKETSICSGIAILDLTNTAKDLIGMYYKTNESLLMLVVGYLIILLPVSILLTFIERKVRYAEFGH